ncbi:MAG: substrate-binding domain-containing protein [Ignavibacteriae bacterium]|nr:substrate-binding domain-containing protein [Ignavibacteriota bacterium]
MNISKFSLTVFLSCLMIGSFGCEFGQIKSKATIGELSIIADENIMPVIPALVSEFERLNPEAKIKVSYKPSRIAITDFLNKDTRFIMLAGDFNSEDRKYIEEYKLEMQRYEVASDAVAFIVNPENPVIRLTSDDLKKIFTGEYTKWTDISVQDKEQNENVKSVMKAKENEIKVYIQRPNSGTYGYVKDTVLAGMEYLKTAQICSTSTQMLEMIRENKNAVGISNLCWISKGNQDSLDTSVRAVRISRIYPGGRQDDFIELHQGLVYARKYPYIRKVVVYTTILDIQLSTGWITFLLGKDGQKVFLEKGMVPVNQPVRLIQIE